MLFLLFQLNEERYALDAAQIVEVLPLLPVQTIPQAPRGVRGVLSYRAMPVPIIDLSELIVGRPAEHRLTTRIVLIQNSSEINARSRAVRTDTQQRLLGLIAERVTETMQLDPAQFKPCGVDGRGAPFLGAVVYKAPGFIRQILTDTLLTGAARDALFERSAVLS
jgi:chemotaxis-related protein WspB